MGPPLRLVSDLAARLDHAGIRYCHFKSNIHLEQGLCGDTDLDVLIERASACLPAVLAQSGFKRFSPPPGGDYPGIEDHLGMDRDTGRLAHLHLHHQLTTGERHLKGYRIPWEEQALATRVRHPESGFFIADPHFELVFLLVRNALKLRLSDGMTAAWGRDRVRDELAAEVAWLRGRTESPRLVELGTSLLNERAGREIGEIAAAGPSLHGLRRLRRHAIRGLRVHRTYRPGVAHVERWRREAQSVGASIGRRFPSLAGPVSRTDPRGGVLVVFVGPDGAGKSQLARHVVAWLGWKLDARMIYFGSGQGPTSLLRWPLKLLQAASIPLGLHRRSRPPGPGAARGTRRRRLSRLVEPSARALWALVLALEKRERLELAWRERNRGLVVVCDRYPQDQVRGFNDGPLLHHWHESRSPLLRALARWESVPYVLAQAHPPELVIKLAVSPEVATRRKPDMRESEITRRSRVLEALQYPPGTRVVELNADRPWEEVLLEARRAVWEVL